MTTTESTINTALLCTTLTHVEAHRDEWDQGYWARETGCGTTCCLAGWACVLAGYSIDWTQLSDDGQAWRLTNGRPISEAAQELLGLSAQQAMALFHAANDLDDLRQIVDGLTDSRWRDADFTTPTEARQ